MIRCLILDDESAAIAILQHYIKKTPFLELAGSCQDPMEGIQLINERNIDLVFLDIRMPELNGLDLIKVVPRKCKYILTTAYEQYALQGYELNVVDYLLKPISFPRFTQAAQKAWSVLQSNIANNDATGTDHFYVKTELKGKVVKIYYNEIEYIESEKNYVAIHKGNEKTLVLSNMKNIEELLDKKMFMRVHRSFIIPISKIKGVEGSRIYLKGSETPIPLGENYRADFFKLINDRLI